MKKIYNSGFGLMLLCTLPLVSGCVGIAPKAYDSEDYEIADSALNLTRDDFRNLPFVGKEGVSTGLADAKTSATLGEPPIPDLAPILSAPPVPKLGQTKLVSIAVTDDVPLKDVLLELSRLAAVDIEVDANIQGGISFRATQRPFNEVIERISEFAGLRYSMKNGVLRIERDMPYVDIYSLDFLNMERSTTNQVSLSTSVLSSGGGGGSAGSSGSSEGGSGGGGGLTTGSTTSISSSTKSDFWQKFEDGITQILTFTPSFRSSEFSGLQSQNENAAPAPVAQSGTATTTAQAAGQYTINKQAGTISVLATERQHTLVKEFIKRLEYNSSAQVLIEAKIVEVTLNERYQSGIRWTDFGSTSLNTDVNFGGISDGLGSAGIALQKGIITGLDVNLDLAVDLMQRFGATRTLSSPRLHAINNQQSVLTFAKNEVYFTVTVEKEQSDSTSTSNTTYTVNSQINTVPIGIIMSLLPSINRDTGEITLSVRPTLSRVVDRVVDPGLTLAKALTPDLADVNVENKIPVVEVRELDSILKVKSGQVMVIGGLMEDKGINTETGVPGAEEIPVLGHLFKGSDRSRDTSELVILIRATLVGESGNLHEADKAIYERFTRDPRPLSIK